MNNSSINSVLGGISIPLGAIMISIFLIQGQAPYESACMGWHFKKTPTGICVFEGKMNAALYVEILDKTLLPFLHESFPDGNHRFMQENDPKHVSKKAQAFYEEKKT